MKNMDSFIVEIFFEDWKVFLKWGFFNVFVSCLSEDFDQVDFDFYSKKFSGVE